MSKIKAKKQDEQDAENSRRQTVMKRIFEWLLEKYHSLNMIPEVKNAWIIGLLGIIAAIIIAVATIFGGNKPAQTVSVGSSGAIAVAGNTRDVTINYQVTEGSATKDVIKELDKKIADTDGKLELTRSELTLLSKALKDLDQRTSGIQKLPDGRTLFGKIVSGDPALIIQEHNAAIQASNAGNHEESLKHSQVAINAYEETKKKIDEAQPIMTSGNLEGENAGKLYWLATITAQQIRKSDVAHEYAKKMIEVNPSPLNKSLYATTLFNLGKRQEALEIVREVATSEPNNPKIIEIKNKLVGLMSGIANGQKK